MLPYQFPIEAQRSIPSGRLGVFFFFYKHICFHLKSLNRIMKRVSVSHRILLLFTAGIVTGLIIQTFTLLLGSLQYTKTLNSSRSFLKKKNVVINY